MQGYPHPLNNCDTWEQVELLEERMLQHSCDNNRVKRAQGTCNIQVALLTVASVPVPSGSSTCIQSHNCSSIQLAETLRTISGFSQHYCN